MKQLILILILALMTSCTPAPTDHPKVMFRAIYLVQGAGQLSKEDLRDHPEVKVTSSFDEFKQLARDKTALWLDIHAAGLVDKDWLNQKPQRYYPIVLIGLSDPLCAFRDTLGGFGVIEGPYADCSFPPPGFSIWMLDEDTSSRSSAFMHGYEQIPSAGDILEKTNLLLEGQDPLLQSK